METNVVHAGNSINNDRPNVIKSMSKFPQSFQVAGTYRFGEIAPFFCKEAVKGDHNPLQSSHNLRSLNLKSPLMSGLTLKKDFYQVPFESILPFNWEKFFTQPINGDDVPSDVSCNVPVRLFWAEFNSLCSYIDGYFRAGTFDNLDQFNRFLECVCALDMMCGAGSLPSALNLHFDRFIKCYTDQGATEVPFSTYFDNIFSHFASSLNGLYCSFLNLDGSTQRHYYINSDPTDPSRDSSLSWREFIDLCKDQPYISFRADDGVLDRINRVFSDVVSDGWNINCLEFDSSNNEEINLAPLWAYQLCCFEFYVNDRIDDLYSAQLFRQYVHDISLADGSFTNTTFEYNGLTYEYDYLSGYYVSKALTVYYYNNPSRRFFLSALMHFRRSLRYVDYFTGAKTRPLAIGDVSVSAAGGSVSIIDTVQKTQFARFLQNVNRIGRKWSNYLAGLFPGGAPAYDWHSPKWLGHTADGISALETQNTGDAQMTQANSVTSNLRTNASRYAFQVEIDRPSILIGLQYFDIPRFYLSTWDRMYWHTDRYEMFNPDLQFIGDQPIFKAELYHYRDIVTPFGYQSRYMEYKQSYNYGFGGFKDNLPSWIFKADDKLYGRSTDLVIGSDYIRSRSSELDPYFVSLTGYSNGSYWHFIQINTNGYDPTRPMVASPGLL